MFKGYKILLLPTKEQEELMWKHVNGSRFIYNLYKDIRDTHYKYYKNTEFKNINNNEIRKYITELKKINEYKWLNEISSQTISQSTRDCEDSYKRFYKGLSKYPKFKSKKKSKNSFYVRHNAIYFKNDTVNLEKIGKVKYKSTYNINFKEINKFSKSYCSFNGRYWILSFNIEMHDKLKEEFNPNDVTNENQIIGIDLGLKDLMICSNGEVYKNINKSKEVIRLEKKLKRLQRKVSRKYEKNKQGNKYIKTNNIIKLEYIIKMIYRRLTNIRTNYIYQCINKILKNKPKVIVLEDLDITRMMKNKYLSKQVSNNNFYKIREIFLYKCEELGIKLVIANRWFKSSQICSNCHKETGKKPLNVREFDCPFCGTHHDRDINASINLRHYAIDYLNLNIEY